MHHPLINISVHPSRVNMGFPGGTVVKILSANAGDARDAGLIPGLGRSPRVRNGKPFQYSTWKIPWTEKPGGLQSMGLQRVGHHLVTEHARTSVNSISFPKGNTNSAYSLI